MALLCAYANIADELVAAGYTQDEIAGIKKDMKKYVDLRDIIRCASGEKLDLKTYEADMRHLIDTYIEASEPRTVSPFADMSLLELIVKTGIANAVASQPAGLKSNKDAVAETIFIPPKGVLNKVRLSGFGIQLRLTPVPSTSRFMS